MTASTWTYSDWVTLERGDPARLARLRLHIQEVSDELSRIKRYSVGSSFSVERSTSELAAYLEKRMADEREETRIAAATSGRGVGWSRARTTRR